MKRISKKQGGSTDTHHDHEYTDWGAVEGFTDTFLAQMQEAEMAWNNSSSMQACE